MCSSKWQSSAFVAATESRDIAQMTSLERANTDTWKEDNLLREFPGYLMAVIFGSGILCDRT